MAEDEYWNRFVAKHPKLYSKVIPNGIRPSKNDADVDIQRAHREKLGIPNSCCFVVGTVCMLRPDRKPWLYIPIFDQVARVLGPEVHFVIAGGGAELDRMRSLVIEHGLEGRVHLPGLDLNPDLTRSIMDLYITLNVGPLTGIAAMEAASVALPVLAIQLRNDYQNTPNDWIWSSADPKEVVEKIIHLIRSPQERREIADRQKAYIIANHTIEAVANSYQTLYQTAIERSGIQTKMSAQLFKKGS
jgi:glycosyltransferase involved in cell wall biosynthesis